MFLQLGTVWVPAGGTWDHTDQAESGEQGWEGDGNFTKRKGRKNKPRLLMAFPADIKYQHQLVDGGWSPHRSEGSGFCQPRGTG